MMLAYSAPPHSARQRALDVATLPQRSALLASIQARAVRVWWCVGVIQTGSGDGLQIKFDRDSQTDQCRLDQMLLLVQADWLPTMSSPSCPPPQPHLDSLRKYTYGKHIVNKVEALLAAQAAQAEESIAAAATAEPATAMPLPVAVAAEQ